MTSTSWILGTSVDSNDEIRLDKYDKFISYLVHLDEPRCLMLVCKPGLLSEAPINLKQDQGYYYRNSDKDIEIIVIEWLDNVNLTQDEIEKLLYTAAVHLEIREQEERELSEIDNTEEDVEKL